VKAIYFLRNNWRRTSGRVHGESPGDRPRGSAHNLRSYAYVENGCAQYTCGSSVLRSRLDKSHEGQPEFPGQTYPPIAKKVCVIYPHDSILTVLGVAIKIEANRVRNDKKNQGFIQNTPVPGGETPSTSAYRSSHPPRPITQCKHDHNDQR